MTAGGPPEGAAPHVPVLIEALVRAIAPVRGTWIDGTFGAGGYTPATLLPYVGGNDDIDTGVNRSSSLTLSLLANTTYTLVLTTWESDLGAATYGESQYGGFQTSIDSGASTTTLTVIPEPRTYGLLLSLCTGVVVAVRGGRRCFVRA